MHIPDGVLDTKTIIATSVIGASAVSYSAYKVRSQLTVEKVKHMALVGGFIFAAQMINIPIMHGTSGHLLGAALAAILLGPWLGTMTMSLVLLVQCLFFGDGGFLALGANILCAGVVASVVSYSVQAVLKAKVNQIFISLIAGWLSIVTSSASIALILLWLNPLNFMNVMSAMTSVHAQIGVVEACITSAVVFAATYKVANKKTIEV